MHVVAVMVAAVQGDPAVADDAVAAPIQRGQAADPIAAWPAPAGQEEAPPLGLLHCHAHEEDVVAAAAAAAVLLSVHDVLAVQVVAERVEDGQKEVLVEVLQRCTAGGCRCA